MTIDATLGDLTSLEEFVIKAMKKQVLPKKVAAFLWELFEKDTNSGKNQRRNNDEEMEVEADNNNNNNANTQKMLEARGALMIITMMANVDPVIVKTKLQVIVSSLGTRSRADPLIAKYACIALQKLAITKASMAQTDKDSAPKGTPTPFGKTLKIDSKFRRCYCAV